jgi:peptidoglycan/LPS O-acetylase OafA/YrhL
MAPPKNYRPDIDGLRAIAVLLVIAFHVFPEGLRGGFIGVDIFFVISGYLITGIVINALRKGEFQFLDFYSRRIRRIVPALLVVLLATSLLGWITLQFDQIQQLLSHVEAGAFFFSNFKLITESGYFDSAAADKPLLHLWSLAVEEQFYLVWPLILSIVWRMRISGRIAIGTLAVVSLLMNMYLVVFRVDTTAAFYLPQARFWELMVGAFLACQQPKPSRANPFKINIQSFAGALCVLTGLWLIGIDRLPGGFHALLPCLGTALIISASPEAWINRQLLSQRWLVAVGLISFPLYLWHWPLLTFLHLNFGEQANDLWKLGAVALSFLLAWMTYALIERRLRWKQSATRYLAGAIVIVGITATVTSANMDTLVFENGWRDAATDVKVLRQFTGAVGKYTTNQDCLDRYPFAAAEAYGWWFCIKNKPSEATVLLLGNSFANQLYPGLSTNPDLKHHTFLSVGTCDAADSPWVDNGVRKHPCRGTAQETNREYIDNILRTTKSLRYVIVGGLNTSPNLNYIGYVRQRLDYLQSLNLKVIIFKPHLAPGFHPRACFSSINGRTPRNCSFSPVRRVRMDAQFQVLVDAIHTSHPQVLFFDQNDIYCPSTSDKCSFVKDELPLNRDEVHISEYGASKMTEDFVKWAKVNDPGFLNPLEQSLREPIK